MRSYILRFKILLCCVLIDLKNFYYIVLHMGINLPNNNKSGEISPTVHFNGIFGRTVYIYFFGRGAHQYQHLQYI
jgi:hypothetical protein